MNNELLVKSVRELCKKNNITPSQLENELNFGAGLISRWTKSSPSIDKIIDIADYFHVSLDEVVGRNNIISDDFLKVLYNKTVNKEIQWKTFDIAEDESGIKKYLYDTKGYVFFSQEQYDCFCETHKETSYYFEYMSGFISIYAMYEYQKVTTPNEIKLFIQPDIKAELILQPYNFNELLPLWLKVITSLDDKVPDEIKAADLKQQILSASPEQLFLDNYEKRLDEMETCESEIDELVQDEKTKQILAHVNSPEIAQLIRIFTDPKMIQAMNSTMKLTQYFSEIKTEKENTDK